MAAKLTGPVLGQRANGVLHHQPVVPGNGACDQRRHGEPWVCSSGGDEVCEAGREESKSRRQAVAEWTAGRTRRQEGPLHDDPESERDDGDGLSAFLASRTRRRRAQCRQSVSATAGQLWRKTAATGRSRRRAARIHWWMRRERATTTRAAQSPPGSSPKRAGAGGNAREPSREERTRRRQRARPPSRVIDQKSDVPVKSRAWRRGQLPSNVLRRRSWTATSPMRRRGRTQGGGDPR